MHTGFVDVAKLREMESTIWGNTSKSGAIQIVVTRIGSPNRQLYSKMDYANMRPDEKSSEYGIANNEPRKTTQGLWYVSYGMDDGGQHARRQRHFIDAGARWSIRLVARQVESRLTAQQVLDQGIAALWLLCCYGGVGSKARKGFGSMQAKELGNWNRKSCETKAIEFRDAFGCTGSFIESRTQSPSLALALPPVEAQFRWQNVWSVLDQVGFAFQVFAKKYAHRMEKMALGLPRRIGPGKSGRFQPTGAMLEVFHSQNANLRHASPVHIHVSRSESGMIVRALAIPSPCLPDLPTSRAFLHEFLDCFRAELARRSALVEVSRGADLLRPADRGQSPRPQRPTETPTRKGPKAGDKVQAELLEERTKKGGWRAKHIDTSMIGPIHNSESVPNDKRPGEKVELIVASNNGQVMAFRWPT